MRKWNWWLIGIIGLGLALRLWAIDFGLPYTVAPDESTLITPSLRMIKFGDLEPRSLGYPHLSFYLVGIAFLVYFVVGHALGYFTSVSDLPYPEIVTVGVGRIGLPSEFLLARGVSALFGAGVIWLVYKIVSRFTPDRRVALIATGFAAICPINIYNSHLIRPDIFALFFLLLAYLWIDRAGVNPSLRNYVWAGIGIGLATSAKYNAGLIAVALVAAQLLNFGWRGFFRREIIAAGLCSLLAFAATTPFAILNFQSLAPGLQLAVQAQSVHDGAETNSFVWYLSNLWAQEGFLTILAVIQIARIVMARDRRAVVLVVFPFVYLVFISAFAVHTDRTVMLLVPFLSILAAMFLIDLDKVFRPKLSLPLARLGLIVAVILITITPLVAAVRATWELSNTSSREAARVWIDSNLPRGARIAQESYTPYLDPDHFVVKGVSGMADHSLEWYTQNGFEYLIFSQGTYGRFFAEPERFPDWIDRYNQFFNRLQLIRLFNDGNYEIRIYKTDAVLPARRMNVRFGNEGELIELVGYEQIGEKWIAPAPLHVKLYWWRLSHPDESLEVSLRLYAANDREIGSARANLEPSSIQFGGIYTTDLQIATLPDAEPGIYRLQVNVIQTKFAYALPAISVAQGKIDQVFLDPLKLSLPAIPPSEWLDVNRVNVTWANQIALRGYKVSSTRAHQGDTISLKVYWECLASLSQDYTVFVHLIDAQGKLRVQSDTQPLHGAYTTSLWDVNEIVSDEYFLALPKDLVAGDYFVILGWYEYSNLTRLDVNGSDGIKPTDHWVVPEPIQLIQ